MRELEFLIFFFLFLFFWDVEVFHRLPQAPVPEESEARETESCGGASALRFPVTGIGHNRDGTAVNKETSEGQKLEDEELSSDLTRDLYEEMKIKRSAIFISPRSL